MKLRRALIFEDAVDFYWSRSRILEKLNSLPTETLPEGARPVLGPDATALGQVFWYTLEGLDEEGKPAGGWGLDDLRSIQDWHVRLGLLAADGVSEVASIGGFVREYQIDVDPDAMRAFGVSLEEVFRAIQMANADVGARTIEVNNVEYLIRGVGFVKSLADIENSVIAVRDNVPVYVRNVAHVAYGPALRRGALDKEGAEAVGGVVVARYGENPLATLNNVKAKIAEMEPGLPQKILEDGTRSRVAVVPFYDRSGLIYETLETLNKALAEEVLVTVLVVVLAGMRLRGSLLISGLLPLAVLACFAAMKAFGVDANVVALSGIAIAIGTMVDMGIMICENILRRLDEAPSHEDSLSVVLAASKEVGGAVLTSVATTVVSFLPVFAMEGAEGKLFQPLAWTKTFALLASVIAAVSILPPLAQLWFAGRLRGKTLRKATLGAGVAGMLALGGWAMQRWSGMAPSFLWWTAGLTLLGTAAYYWARERVLPKRRVWVEKAANALVALAVAGVLAARWSPLGSEKGVLWNGLFVGLLVSGLLSLFYGLQRFYGDILRWCLRHRMAFLSLPIALAFLGGTAWLGLDFFLGWLPASVRAWSPVSALARQFPGLGKEFMPALDEGSYLYMPTTMPHASIGESMDAMRKQDMAIRQIPEVESVVGKLGRAETALDPAPVSMMETIINYRPEYLTDPKGRRLRFQFNAKETDWFHDAEGNPLDAPDGKPYRVQGRFLRNADGNLLPDAGGKPFRLWRPALIPDLETSAESANRGRAAWPGIRRAEDIWEFIVEAAQMPGSTSAPKLQPIAARTVMLQSGMRAPMGVKIQGPDLRTIEQVGLQVEALLKQANSVEPSTVLADRMVGKPYLEIEIDRESIARYGISLAKVQEVIEVGIGGKTIMTTVEGRERYPVRVRYLRELRDQIESLGRILVTAPDGAQIPLEQLAVISYRRGPQSIRSEDARLTGYVLFDKKPGWAEADAVSEASAFLQTKIQSGELELPAGVSYAFAGSYENQVRSEKKLKILLPLALLVIFGLLYLHFQSTANSLLVFSGVLVAWSGGFLLLWLYGQDWFLNFSAFGVSMRELFQARPIHLSVAVWVGFLALFGIASDNGVILATCLEQRFGQSRPQSVEAIRQAAMEAGQRRVRPCLMTAATTILALLPVLTAKGRGADVMMPMAIPTVGGMVAVILSLFLVPVLYCAMKEFAFHSKIAKANQHDD